MEARTMRKVQIREIENTTHCNSASDQYANDGALKNAEFAGFIFDESTEYDYIPMLVRSTMAAEGVREFEFDTSYQASEELESVASPADELPLHHPLRIKMVEKLVSSEIKPLEAHARTQTENNGNRSKNISSNCSPEAEELGFPSSHKPAGDGLPYEVCKYWMKTYQSKKLMDSTESQRTTFSHKLKASKKYLKSLFSKASKTRGANDHHTENSSSIQRESNHHHGDAATFDRSSPTENRTTHRKSFSASFLFSKSFPLIPKSKSKPFSSSNNVSPVNSAAFLKRGMRSANSDVENDIQRTIDHCKQSYADVPKNVMDTSEYVQGNTPDPEEYPDGHVHGRSWSGSTLAACDRLEKPGDHVK